jgi:stage III sporulation protein AF
MSALGEWLKQIILVVVLAVLSDMLLPTKSMQKYVRVVMGLAIIAVMLQPIMPFFRRDWADHMADVAAREILNGNATASTVPLPNINQVKQDMQAQEDERANQLVGAELLSGIEKAFSCDVIDVTVKNVTHGPQAMTVQIQISHLDEMKQFDIQQWVATDLQISKSQVAVNTNSGG